MDIKTNEIGDLLRSQIKNINENVDVNEVGEVLEIGDGVARTSGLGSVMSSELVELPNDVFGLALNLDEDWDSELVKVDSPESMSTRDASGKVLNHLATKTNLIFGGSADLAGSTKTLISSSTSISSDDFSGLNMHYGVREHAMAAINNGISLYANFIPFGGTFLIFSDYMRNSIRLSALSKSQVLYVLTHDSIALGEDGPTHQPISQLMSLRLIPNLNVYRPADYYETIYCYKKSLTTKMTPSAFILSRQALPTLKNRDFKDIQNGAYIIEKEYEKSGLGSPIFT